MFLPDEAVILPYSSCIIMTGAVIYEQSNRHINVQSKCKYVPVADFALVYSASLNETYSSVFAVCLCVCKCVFECECVSMLCIE